MKEAVKACLGLSVVFALLAFAVGQSPTAEQKRGIDVSKLTDGTYELVIKEGKATISPLSWLNADQPDPGPGPEPLPERAKEIKQAAMTVQDPKREENAQKLALLHREIAKLVDDETLKGQQNIAVMLKKSREMLLTNVEQEAWKPVFDLQGNHWDKMVQDGASDADYSAYLGESAQGLEASVVNVQDEPDWLELILKIIKIILELINPQSPVTPAPPADSSSHLFSLEMVA